jgi:hypothetical protein
MKIYITPLRLLLLISIVTLSCNRISGQVVVNKRSTLSLGSANQSQTGKSLPIQQSIGQSSVIGIIQSNNYALSQGFIQPGFGAGENLMSDIDQLKASLFPNPLNSDLSIEFSDEISTLIDVEICNVLGKVVFKNQYSASQKLEIDLGSLSNGIYFIKIITANKQLTSKLIKE